MVGRTAIESHSFGVTTRSLPAPGTNHHRHLACQSISTKLGRITANPEIFGGKPIIRGMRVSVEMILSLLAQGEKADTILADYPDLERADLRACLGYAHAAISHDKLDSLQISGVMRFLIDLP